MSHARVGLVLSGGGTRGLAQIGVWSVLEQLAFRPAAIAGCSIGGLVGAMIAAGKTSSEMADFALSRNLLPLFRAPISPRGVGNPARFERSFLAFLGHDRFEDLTFPLIVNATDLTSGTTVVYNRGPLWPALRASFAVPGLWAPMTEDQRVLVDGGVLDNYPISILPPEVRRFILVNVSPRLTLNPGRHSIIDILRTSLNLAQSALARERLADRDARDFVIVEPDVRRRVLLEHSKHFAELIQVGKVAGEHQRTELTQFLT